MVRSVGILFFVILFSACGNKNMVYSEYESLNNGLWKTSDTIKFSFSELDTLSNYNVFINVRNDDNYKFSNLFLITELEAPNGETVIDTLEYEMAFPDGTWMGKGSGGIKENKLWFRENVVFPDMGVYSFKVCHAMRENGELEGVQELDGITDIGLQIEKTLVP